MTLRIRGLLWVEGSSGSELTPLSLSPAEDATM